MPETRGMWMAKTIGLVILAAVLTTVLAAAIQKMIWGKTNSGVGGGAATGVAVAVWMARRKVPIADETPKS